MELPGLPSGARLLSADDAVDKLVTGDHAGATTGSVALDATLIDAIRTGVVVACQLPDGQLAFTRRSTDPAR